MKQIKYFIGIVFILLLYSCEDVIELELDSIEPQIVIEANINATENTAKVIISKSNDFYENGESAKVSGAVVTLSNAENTVYFLEELSEGRYEINNLSIQPGQEWTILIEIEDQSYQASAVVPHPTTIIELQSMEGFNRPFGEDEGNIIVTASWNDPELVESYYRIKTYANDEFQSDLYTVISDKVSGDGKTQNLAVRRGFAENTTITIELLSVDKAYYDYFFQISSVVGEGFNSTTPYNPKGNFDNNVLGYFGIFYTSTMNIEI